MLATAASNSVSMRRRRRDRGSLECREVRQLAEAFVSEQLLVETMQSVVAHLERCRACSDEVQGLRRLRAATRSAIEGEPALKARPEAAAALASHLQAQQGHRSAPRVRRPSWRAIAASFLIVVGVGWGWRYWSASSLSALLHAAVGDHRFCALTFSLDERPMPLQEAALRFGGIYGPLEGVEPAADSLTGGPLRVLERHSCVFGGRRFAHIVLLYKNEKVSLLVTDDPRPLTALASTGTTPSAMPVTDGPCRVVWRPAPLGVRGLVVERR
jgi:hypothetical protein